MSQTIHTFRSLWMRHTTMRLRLCFGAAIVVAIACGLAARSQQSGSGSNGNSGQGTMHEQRQNVDSMSPFDDSDDALLQRHLVALNAERQKQMVSDTNKLLKLAKEVNEQVAADHASAFTPDQMRKIAEIEKLAKSVRERMTSAVGPQQPTPYLGPPYGMTPGVH
jgi:hypothetical protein